MFVEEQHTYINNYLFARASVRNPEGKPAADYAVDYGSRLRSQPFDKRHGSSSATIAIFFLNLIADLVPGCPGFSQSYDSPPLESGETSVRSDHVERRTAIYSGVGRHVLGLS